MSGIIISLVVGAIISYLWGSLPAGYWMGKILRGKDFDIRQHGSHKIGATNVQRTLGTAPAVIVFIIDISKGIGPALLATLLPFLQASGWGVLVAGVAALLGHCFPVFIGFKGGRGVLTGAGAVLVISPLTFAIAAVTTISTIFLTRFVSLGSIVGCFTILICGLIFYFTGLANPAFFARVSLPQMLYLIIGPILVTLFHADNIRRLLAGTERKLGSKKANASEAGTVNV